MITTTLYVPLLFDENTNIYANSSVKRIVDEWFAKLMKEGKDFMKNYIKLTPEEVKNLNMGDKVVLKIGEDFYPSMVTRPMFWNYDADEPDWEVETTNGFSDLFSLYREEKILKKYYNVVVHFEGSIKYSVEATNEYEAKEIAEELFEEETPEMIVAKIADSDCCDCWENT